MNFVRNPQLFYLMRVAITLAKATEVVRGARFLDTRAIQFVEILKFSTTKIVVGLLVICLAWNNVDGSIVQILALVVVLDGGFSREQYDRDCRQRGDDGGGGDLHG